MKTSNIILTGDFNLSLYSASNSEYETSMLPYETSFPEQVPPSCPRQCKLGATLRMACEHAGLIILNGRLPSDIPPAWTRSSAHSVSYIDYTMVSTNLFDNVLDFKIGERMDSDHQPQTLKVLFGISSLTSANQLLKQPQCDNLKRLKWDSELSQQIADTAIDILSRAFASHQTFLAAWQAFPDMVLEKFPQMASEHRGRTLADQK